MTLPPMSPRMAAGTPTEGFRTNPENERDSRRLLFLMLLVLGAGAGAFLAMDLQIWLAGSFAPSRWTP
jgi:hypothetical protein